MTLGFFAASISACSYFGGSDDKPKAESMTAASVGKLSSDCARLQPLFGPDDKELTKEMLNAALKKELAKWDKDASGDLSYLEIQPLNEELRSENVGASPVRDWNADGVVDDKEFGAGWRTMFDLCDRNHNSSVSVRELGFSPNVVAPRTAPAPEKPKPEGSSAPRQGGY